jgi:3-oxoacyl-ACP reductase-like protein
MSIFESIKNAIFGHGATTSSSPALKPASAAPAAGQPAATRPAPPVAPSAPAATPAPVDIEPVLDGLNSKSPQKLNWRTSIVDLMKLVGLDASFQNRQALAKELGYTGDTGDSAAMNIWLHKQVMKKLAENGGKVPASLQH